MLDSKIEGFVFKIYTMVLTKQNIADIARAYYQLHGVSPKLKDIPNLPFSKKQLIKLFGKWNTMLLFARLPLNRHPTRSLVCPECGERFVRQVKEIRKSLRQFCGSACNAKYYTTGRKHSEETKAKISASLKAHRIFSTK